jgi:Tfp pilus assembly protein PilF
VDSLVLGALVGEHALREPDLGDAHRPDFGVAVAHEVLDEFLPAGVFHPRERDVGREVVFLGLEAVLLDELHLNGLVQPREFGAAVADAEPHHGDIVETREHAEPAEFRVERLDAALVDRAPQGIREFVLAGVLNLAEELHRHVGLAGVHEVQALGVGEFGLQVRYVVGEPVGEVDTDEQPHTGRSRCVALNLPAALDACMTDREEPEPPEAPDDHEFSEGQGFDEPYDGFDLDPPELSVDDPSSVDPVDSRVVSDSLDERVVQNDDVDADELIDVGLSYLGINRHEQAADAFERAARFTDDEDIEQEAWVNKGIAHGQMEEWDEAVGAHREALFVAEDGDFEAEAHTNLAYALWEFSEDEQAYEHAEEAVRKNDRLPQAWYNLGFIENERSRHEQALDALNNAVRLGFQQADVYEEKQRALEALGRDEEAQKVAEQAEDIREAQERDLVERE